MDKSRANILQIQKYLNGELDAKAMHKLEREAQDDPFLMDALEGYQSSGKNQQPSLDLLAAQLNARTTKKERRVIPWTTISIAAGVVGFMVVVGLFYKGSNNTIEPKLTAKIAEAPAITADTVSALTPPATAGKNADVVASEPAVPFSKSTQKITNHATADGSRMQAKPAEAVANADVAIRTDSTPMVGSGDIPLDEMVMNTIAKQRERDTVEMPLTVPVAKLSMSQTLEGKVAGVSTSEVKRPASEYELAKLGLPSQYSTQAPKDKVTPLSAAGKTYSKPEPTAIYKSGNAAPAGNTEPALSGFENAGNAVNTSLLNNANANIGGIRSDTQAGYFSRRDDLNTLALAHPEKGWVMYQLYLSQKCTLPAGQKTGKVELKFTVAPDGGISNITVTQSLSPVADKAAIRIISEGPKWVGNTNGKPEEKTLQLEFVNK